LTTPAPPEKRPICDYEGSAYRTEFWVAERAYEDAAEREALSRLLPPTGGRLIEIGAGYGRLADLYGGYDEVVFFDYALSQLRQAQELWGRSGPGGRPRYIYVAGDFYRLPFASGLFDTVTTIRTLHHAADAPAVLEGVGRIAAPGGAFLLEFANKRNLKSILRYLLGRQTWSPFDWEPVEFAALNFDFHPAWIAEQLERAGMRIEKQRAVSYLRLGLLKRAAPTSLLVAVDRLLQPTGAVCQLSPSAFVRCTAAEDKPAAPAGAFFRCLFCGSTMLEEDDAEEDALTCVDCGQRFEIRDGVYDFKSIGEET
jgi:ubiquinone/menaquinone biosynthesis C-methylase UbiE/DNA-directed RNA polymerase subunit RPC12/RpoP